MMKFKTLIRIFGLAGLILLIGCKQKVEIKLTEEQEFEILATRFAETHEYNISEYNCINYSDDFKKIADMLGFKTIEITSCPLKEEWDNETICHRFIGVYKDFEPIEGKFIDYSEEYPYRVIIRR